MRIAMTITTSHDKYSKIKSTRFVYRFSVLNACEQNEVGQLCGE